MGFPSVCARRGGFIAAFVVPVFPVEAASQVGVEIQAYPAGIIAAARVDVGSTVSLYAGGNFTDRRDFGRHANEQGQGLGGGVGVRLRGSAPGWQLGARLDLWSLTINWFDNVPSQLPGVGPPGVVRRGSSTVQVVQPTVRVGYMVFPSGTTALTVGLALGMEVNVRTRGEEVGEGAILLLGASLMFRL